MSVYAGAHICVEQQNQHEIDVIFFLCCPKGSE